MIRNRLRKLAQSLLGGPQTPQPGKMRKAAPVSQTQHNAYRRPEASEASTATVDAVEPIAADVDEAAGAEVNIEIDSAMAAEWQAEGKPMTFLDIRELPEMAAGHVEGATLIPMGDVLERLGEIPRDQTLVVYCASGARSFGVTEALRERGFEQAWSMVGGMGSWLALGKPQVIPPPKASFQPGEAAILCAAAAKRLKIPKKRSLGTIQEVRDVEGTARYVLGVPGHRGRPQQRLGELSDEDLSRP